MHEPLRIFAVAASRRKESLNRRLLESVVRALRLLGAQVTTVDFSALDVPSYNFDVQESEGFPPETLEWKRHLESADALVIASPEFNYSMPGNLKNAIDWISRVKPVPLRRKPILLLSASPSVSGGVRGLGALRVPLEGLGAFVFPDVFALAEASEAMDANGQIIDPVLASRLHRTLQEFSQFAKAVKN